MTRGAAAIAYLIVDRLDQAEALLDEMLVLARNTGFVLAEARALICQTISYESYSLNKARRVGLRVSFRLARS